MNSFRNIFLIIFILSLIILTGIECFINETIKREHVLGWACVSIALGALAAIIGKKADAGH